MKVVIDTETTGIDERAEIIELSIIDARDGKSLLSTLVCPVDDIPEEATEVNGITMADVANAPRWRDIHDSVCELLSRAEVVMAYGANFDIRMMQQSAGRYNLTLPMVRYHCILSEFATNHRREVDDEGRWVRTKLIDAAKRCGLDIPKTLHRAEADALLALKLHNFLHSAPKGTVRALNLSNRVATIMDKKRITMVSQLVVIPPKKLLGFPGMGDAGLAEVRNALWERGLKLQGDF